MAKRTAHILSCWGKVWGFVLFLCEVSRGYLGHGECVSRGVSRLVLCYVMCRVMMCTEVQLCDTGLLIRSYHLQCTHYSSVPMFNSLHKSYE